MAIPRAALLGRRGVGGRATARALSAPKTLGWIGCNGTRDWSPRVDWVGPRAIRSWTPPAAAAPGGARGGAEAGDTVRQRHAEGQLRGLTKAELLDFARSEGLKVSGNKPDLVERISSHLAGGAPATSHGAGGARTAQGAGKPAARAKKPPPLVFERPPGAPSLAAAPAAPGPTRRLLSWNVNGMRALLGKGGGLDPLGAVVTEGSPDIIMLQETKMQEKHVEEVVRALEATEWYPRFEARSTAWSCSTARLGYSGTAMLSRTPCDFTLGVGVPELDLEGRVITAELEDMFVVTVYTPNAGQALARLSYRTSEWDRAFQAHVLRLQASKPVVVCGDLNVARDPIDLHAPGTSGGRAGYTPEERASFEKLLAATGLVDTFRHVHGGVEDVYSYWCYRSGARKGNRGWRIDYFLASEGLRGRVHDARVLNHVPGSDHCPVALELLI